MRPTPKPFSLHPSSFQENGEVCGQAYDSGRLLRVHWKKGTITRVDFLKNSKKNLGWLAPALLDLQVNGFAGVDFQKDEVSLEQLLHAARRLRNSGCSRFFPTFITDTWSDLMGRLAHFKRLRRQSRELEQAIAGWHVEGPFLSPEPGFRGAHDLQKMQDPLPDHIRELRRVTDSDPVLLTLAPERRGSLPAIRLAVQLGMKVSLGHTNASWEQLQAAVKAGATGFTHLGNGCPQQLDRHDNILWRVLNTPGLTLGIIPDGLHVSPHLFRILHRFKNPSPIYYTTDAMSAAGSPPGKYSLGKIELEVGGDGVVRFPGATNFAGSSLRPLEGIFRAAEMTGPSWRKIWTHGSTVPARFMGIKTGLRKGAPAALCLLQDH